MSHKLIEIKDVTKLYGDKGNMVRALDGVSLQIRAGEFVAIVGSSGSGKSTLMNMLGLLDMPTGGSYVLDGQEVCHMGDDTLSEIRNRRIGFVFQGFNLISSLNAVENVELPLIYRGIPHERRRLLCYDALERVGLSGRLSHRPTQMSGGQQQRVAIARAIAASPPIILADEPTGNLDSASGAGVLEILRDLWKEGNTVILITHDEGIASETPRVIQMKDGKVLSDKVRQDTVSEAGLSLVQKRKTERMEAI